MKKIGIIVQRYGNEVNGGAEFHARILAEKLNHKYEIEILTTTALDYHDWKNHYPQGKTLVNNIPVIRFPTTVFSNKKRRKVARALQKRKKYFKFLKWFGIFNFIDNKFNISEPTKKDQIDWLICQGPYCPDLIKYLNINKDKYDVFIFFTYLYYPTAVGMELVREKSIFIPTAHDEPPLYTKPYENIFSVPQFIMYNTNSEMELVRKNFKNISQNHDVAGVGIEKHEISNGFKIKDSLNFKFQYFVYIGRIDPNKGCKELIEMFSIYSKENPNIKLVIIGKNMMKLQANENIILTGFVSEDEKYYLLENAEALILPSKYESLSMVTLEAMLVGKQVIVNENCEVLKNHITESETGFYYNNYNEFKFALNSILNLSNEEKIKSSVKAQQYVTKNYNWEMILEKFDKAIELTSSK